MGDVRYKAKALHDPFHAFGLKRSNEFGKFPGRKATQTQIEFIKRHKIVVESLGSLSMTDAGKLIGEIKKRKSQGLCTWRQASTISKIVKMSDVDYKKLPFTSASKAIDIISKNQWSVEGMPDHDKAALREILSGQRSQSLPGMWKGEMVPR